MSETSVGTDLLQPFQIFTKLVIQIVTENLAETTIFNILLSVKEPVWDFVLARVSHDCNHTLNLRKIIKKDTVHSYTDRGEGEMENKF